MVAQTKIGILFSGSGSNMKALAAHIVRPEVPAELVLTVSNNPQASGIDFCRAQKIPCHVLDHTAYTQREDFDAALNTTLREASVELICAAGFMRLLTPNFVESWRDQILNIHPSLLPKYKGLHTHKRVLEAGDAVHGCTVHYMRTEMDDGPILVQKRVDVHPDDTPETLAARVLEQEHQAYPQALDMALEKL